jgi:hypothetical protein
MLFCFLMQACISVWPEVRYVVGYNHIVHVANTCDAAFVCDVSTDVSPEPQRVSVPPRTEIEVVTFIGSPARVFVPNVQCKLDERP